MRTNRQVRDYIAQIVTIHQQLTSLNLQKRAIAKKLGYGTWRSAELPGVKVVCGTGTAGWCTQWVKVAKNLAERLGLSDRELVEATYGYRRKTFATPTVSVSKDTAHRANPKTRVY